MGTTGQLLSVSGLILKANIPGSTLGEIVCIDDRIRAEVVAFEEDHVLLLPYTCTTGLKQKAKITRTHAPLTLNVGHHLLGRVLNGLGEPIDGKPDMNATEIQTQMTPWSVMRPAPKVLSRKTIDKAFHTGVRAIDGLLTLGQGQRVGLFAGSGVGKSTLLSQIAKGSDADVVVFALVGERGRDAQTFIQHALKDQMDRSVVVCATSDDPALVRIKSAWVATAIAEYFRAQGLNVLLLMDSITRFARAQREVGLALGEPPTRRGYPPSVFARLPELIERAGPDDVGNITAIYTVLVEGSDLEEPIADEVRSLMDGHIVLSRELFLRGRMPPIDPLQSVSRVYESVSSKEQRQSTIQIKQWLHAYETKRDLIQLGAYHMGADPMLDEALKHLPSIEQFLAQASNTNTPATETLHMLFEISKC